MKEFDVAIIGSGPGGYVAAIRAGILGLKTALIEKDPFLGGTCLHRGCIPTKALLHTAELYDEIKKSRDFGIDVSGATLDINRIHTYKQSVVDKMAKGIVFLMKKRKVEVFTGLGSFVDANTIRIAGAAGAENIRARYIIIATGSTPSHLPHLKPNGTTIVDSDIILKTADIPASLAVIGSGAVGTEFASVFASYGSDVHLIELLPRLLPIEDEECSTQLERSLKARGLKCYTSTEVTEAQVNRSGVTLTLKKTDGTSTLDVARVLVATGRRPVLDGLNHEAVGIAMDRRFVAVDEFMRTNVPNIYAIGDVIASPALAHVASREGILAVDHLAGKHVQTINYLAVPNCTYSHPEVASVGLTEKAARDKGYDVRIGKFPFSALGRAQILGDTTGFVKIVADKRYDEVLGVHIIGPRATELIAEATLGVKLETTVEEVANTIHAHPTLAEAMLEAAHGVYGEAIHI
ncbi:MAG TPA: dihydrolipoyl dehydrogenase [Candidatus Krumholzibacteria bacterium]|nr:dihydrolipoyl dehydrogenase [Candidatus Krumholzibacteria bacterium]